MNPQKVPVLPAALGAPFLTSLDPLETTEHSQGIKSSRSQRLIFAKCWDERSKIITALRLDNCPVLNKRAERIDGCCHSPLARKSADGKLTIDHQSCKDRMCPRCQIRRGQEASARISERIRGWSTCRFITLTLKHRDSSLSDELDRLHESFRQLRRLKDWRSRVRSGVWSIEVTRNLEHNRWHVHVHILAEGEYFDQAHLASLWHDVTGDSCIVDVRAVPDRDRQAHYIADYVSKPCNVANWEADDVCEYAAALHGRRLIHTFGKTDKKPIDVEADAGEALDGEYIGPIASLVVGHLAGRTDATHALEIVARKGKAWAHAAGIHAIANASSLPPVEAWENDFLAAQIAIQHALNIAPPPTQITTDARTHAPKPAQSMLFSLHTHAHRYR